MTYHRIYPHVVFNFYMYDQTWLLFATLWYSHYSDTTAVGIKTSGSFILFINSNICVLCHEFKIWPQIVLQIANPRYRRTQIGRFYSSVMCGNLKRLTEYHVEELSKNPNLDLEKIRSTKYLHEFDRYVQGPTWGYPTEGAYYRDASSVDSIHAARIPIFASKYFPILDE